MTTKKEYKKAYKMWRDDGQKMHMALLDIWRITEGYDDTKYLTYGLDHNTVVESVLKYMETHP